MTKNTKILTTETIIFSKSVLNVFSNIFPQIQNTTEISVN